MNNKTYTIGAIRNTIEPWRGTLSIVAENQEKQVFLVYNGIKHWKCSAEQLNRHGWVMVQE